MRFSFILGEILIGLRRSMAMTISVVLVSCVSLFLFGLGMLSQRQVDTMKDYWYDKVQVSIFLCGEQSASANCVDGEVTQAQKDEIQAQLNSAAMAPYVEKVFYESKQQAYERFIEQFKDSVLSENVTPEQLPESYRVQLKDPQQYQIVSQLFANQKGVETVEDQRRLLDQLFGLLNRLTFYSWVLAAITLATTTLLVATTIRLTAYTRRRETGIMRLVGASNFVIQAPFILESVIAAIIGAGLAGAALVSVTHFEIQGRLSKSLRIFTYVDTMDALSIVPWMMVVGVAIAALASFFTLLKYLKV